jgi:hypothetical protein
MLDSLDNERGFGEELYTFEIECESGLIEEIDIFARDMFNARMKAEICANSLIDGGWTAIRSVAAGGSGGLVHIFK